VVPADLLDLANKNPRFRNGAGRGAGGVAAFAGRGRGRGKVIGIGFQAKQAGAGMGAGALGGFVAPSRGPAVLGGNPGTGGFVKAANSSVNVMANSHAMGTVQSPAASMVYGASVASRANVPSVTGNVAPAGMHPDRAALLGLTVAPSDPTVDSASPVPAAVTVPTGFQPAIGASMDIGFGAGRGRGAPSNMPSRAKAGLGVRKFGEYGEALGGFVAPVTTGLSAATSITGNVLRSVFHSSSSDSLAATYTAPSLLSSNAGVMSASSISQLASSDAPRKRSRWDSAGPEAFVNTEVTMASVPADQPPSQLPAASGDSSTGRRSRWDKAAP